MRTSRAAEAQTKEMTLVHYEVARFVDAKSKAWALIRKWQQARLVKVDAQSGTTAYVSLTDAGREAALKAAGGTPTHT